MEIQGKIISGKSYKTRVTDKGSTEIKFSIKSDKYYNFKTYLEKDMEVPPYLKPNMEVKVDTEGGRPNTWDWQGKTYSDLTVHLSMIRGTKTPAEEVGFPPQDPPLEEETPEQRMWRLKELRERKGRCIMYALDTLKMSLSEKLDDLTVEDIENRVKDSADRYLTYIYKGE